MFDIFLNNSGVQLFERALDGSVVKQKAISNNLANVDTPGYKAIEVSFAEQLKRAVKSPGESISLQTTNSRHFPIGGSGSRIETVITNSQTSLRNDKNNVDIDREISKLTGNEIYYDAISRCLNDEFRMLKLVIGHGG